MTMERHDIGWRWPADWRAQRPARFAAREDWLGAAVALFRPRFAKLGSPLPDHLRVGIGFPSSGRGTSVIAECWHSCAAADGATEIWIAPQYGAGSETALLAFLAHELTHAALGQGHGHGPAFAALAAGIGLKGPWTHTEPDWLMACLLPQWAERLGPLPHGGHLLGSFGGVLGDDTPRGRGTCGEGRKPQTNRWVACRCKTCGYVARTSRKWLDAAGAPFCPTGVGAGDWTMPHGRMETEKETET
jgi:hypothetical protein